MPRNTMDSPPARSADSVVCGYTHARTPPHTDTPQNGGECFGCISAATAPLELKLRARRYEGVRRSAHQQCQRGVDSPTVM